jgi:hypothetical protein
VAKNIGIPFAKTSEQIGKTVAEAQKIAKQVLKGQRLFR